ncbi:MAG: lysoplasmalogenase [Bacteroidota bacterium]
MNRFGNLFPILFFLVAIAHMVGILIPDKQLVFLTKPALMPVLVVFMLVSMWPKFTVFSWCIVLGLVFALSGDVCLMLQAEPGLIDQPMFLFGLGSFLITHLLYMMAFIIYPSGEKGFVRVFPKTALPFLLFFIGVNYYLWNDLGEMLVPVVVYSGVITLMAITALNLSEKMDPKAFRLIFTGVLLFMFSDFVIALSRFKTDLHIPYHQVVIMVTYILAQYYIAKGAIRANYLIPKIKESVS